MPNGNAMLLQPPGAASPKQMKMTTCRHPSQSLFFSHPTQIAICKSCMHASDHVKPAGPLFILKLAGSKNPQQVKLNYTKGLCTIHKSEPFFSYSSSVQRSRVVLGASGMSCAYVSAATVFLTHHGKLMCLNFQEKESSGICR